MDKISCISYLLFQSDDQELKNISIQLLNGDILLKNIKGMGKYKSIIAAAEEKINEADVHDVYAFVEEYLLIEA